MNRYFGMYATAPIRFINIFYVGTRLYVDMDMDIDTGETFGSFGGRVYRNELLYTFSSFPNVREIIFLFRGIEDLYGGGHFDVSGINLAEEYRVQ